MTVAVNATVSDADNTVLQGATVAISSGFVSGDVLSFTNSGGITGSYNAATGVLTFTGAASAAAYQTVLNSVRYTNAGDNPTSYGTSTSRTISFNTFDGLAYSDPATVTVAVVGINDAPVNTVPGAQASTEDTSKVIAGISISDPDANPASQNVTVTLAVNHGTVTLLTNVAGGLTSGQITGNGSASITITATQNQINATLGASTGLTYTSTANFNGSDTLTITTNDNGLNGNDPGLTGSGTSEQDSDTVTINIAAVNDAPVVIGDGTEDSATIFEDQPSAAGQTVSSLFSGQYSDAADNQIPNGGASSPGAFSGIAVIANGSGAATGQWQYYNGASWVDIGTVSASAAKLFSASTALRFNPAPDYSGPEPTLTVRLIDNSLGFGITNAQVVDLSAGAAVGGTTAYSTGTVVLGGTVVAVNDAPTITNLQGDTPTYTEDINTSVRIDAGLNAVIADSDSTNFNGGSLTVSITSGFVSARDRVGVFSDAVVSIAGGNVTVNGILIGTISPASPTTGTQTVTINFTTDNATPANVQELLRHVFYGNGFQDPVDGTRGITVTLVDGDGTANGGADTFVATTSVSVVAINDAPSGTDGTATTLEDTSLALSATNFGFSDIDNNAFAGVVISTLPAAGTLFYDADGAGGAAAVAVTAGQFVSAADIAAGKLTFVPAANGNGTGYANFTFAVRDNGGTANGGVDTDQSPNTLTIDVTPVNDAPSGTNGSVNGTEDTRLVLTAANFGFSDVDGNAFNAVRLTTVPANGTLYYDSDGAGGSLGQALVAGDIVDIAAINAGQLVFVPAANASGSPYASFTFQVRDDGGTANGGFNLDPSANTLTINIAAVDDPAVAQPDAVSTAENVVKTGSVFTDNGSGADSDIDGPALSVSAVNGQPASVGTQITLASGALLTVNADGTYSYNANGAFNLVSAATAAATGATNTTATDSFTYTLAGGNTALVTVTVNGVDGPGDQLRGDSGDNTITGTAAGDIINLSQGGNDTASGLGGNDGFYFGAALTAADNVDGGAGTNDQVGLQGNYAGLTLGANNLVNVEQLVLLSGTDTRFGDPGTNLYDYNLTTVDANVAAGQLLTINWNNLRAGEDVTFNGSAETDGWFITYGGGGVDTITGGQQIDGFYFGSAGQWGASDRVDGQGGSDQLGLQGDYTITFGANQLVSIEQIVLLSGADTRFGNFTSTFDYSLTMNDANVAAGDRMMIQANSLRSGETLTFNGSAETDGAFTVIGGAGNDVITGGAGADVIYGGDRGDTLTGGAGNDIFAYTSVTNSNSSERDGIQDFTLGDMIDLSAIDANINTAGNDAFTFIGSAAFSNTAGELRFENISLGGPIWLVQGDVDGDGVSDYEVVLVINDGHPITAGDFLL